MKVHVDILPPHAGVEMMWDEDGHVRFRAVVGEGKARWAGPWTSWYSIHESIELKWDALSGRSVN